MKRRADASPPIERVADVTERLAVLLAAGVAPAAAWRYLTDSLGSGRRDEEPASSATADVIADVVAAAEDGDSISGAVVRAAEGAPVGIRQAWHGLAAAWFVATESGAPLAPCLRDLASAFRSIGQTQRDLQVALAGPAATARLVMALPVIGVLFGMGLGFNTLQTLFTTMPGLACFGAGTVLMIFGGWWNKRMIRRATPTEITPGLSVDLMAIAMMGGGSVERARVIVDQARHRYAVIDTSRHAIESVIDLSNRAGVPAVELLRSEAEQARRQARSRGQRTAASLAVRLMMPLGVCVLPAFMLLGVAPLLLSIISSTVAAI
jgi:tight adherence protein B